MNTRFACAAFLTAALLSPAAHAESGGVMLSSQLRSQAVEMFPPVVYAEALAPLLQANNPCANFNVHRQWVETKLDGWAAALDAHDCRATPELAENALDSAGLFEWYGSLSKGDDEWTCLGAHARRDPIWREPARRMARRIESECPVAVQACADREFKRMLARHNLAMQAPAPEPSIGGTDMVPEMSNIKHSSGHRYGRLDAIAGAHQRGDADQANRWAKALYAKFEAKCRKRNPATPSVSIEEL